MAKAISRIPISKIIFDEEIYPRSRRTVDRYIADLKATIHEDLGLNTFRLNLLGIPQERIALRLQAYRETIRRYLADLAIWPKGPNADLKKVLLLLK